jgi:predicted nucleic acid-binding protein
MILPDVNILVYAFLGDVPGHDRYRTWLLDLVNGDEAFAMSFQVMQ